MRDDSYNPINFLDTIDSAAMAKKAPSIPLATGFNFYTVSYY